MRTFTVLAVVVLAVASAPVTASADVQLAIRDGRVTLVAKDATVRQILSEWARVGQTKIVNVERIPGGPLTLELRDVPERQALKVLLRSVSGYVAAPRVTMAADASLFDRIIVMPTVAVPAPANTGTPPPAFATFQQPQQPSLPEEDRDDGPPPAPQAPGNRGPLFVFQPPGANGAQPAAPGNQPPQAARPSGPAPMPAATFPGAPTTPAPIGVSTPGMMVPAPPGQPGQPGQPQPPLVPRQP